MATRIYFPSTGNPDVTPSTWVFATQINPITLKALTAKINSAMASQAQATGTTSPTFRAALRYVIGPLNAQTIAGTANLCLRASENNAGANATLAMAIKIIQPDGTDRSTLLGVTASDSASSPYEMTTTLSTRRCYTSAEARPPTLTSQDATAGDYLVIEIGTRKR